MAQTRVWWAKSLALIYASRRRVRPARRHAGKNLPAQVGVSLGSLFHSLPLNFPTHLHSEHSFQLRVRACVQSWDIAFDSNTCSVTCAAASTPCLPVFRPHLCLNVNTTRYSDSEVEANDSLLGPSCALLITSSTAFCKFRFPIQQDYSCSCCVSRSRAPLLTKAFQKAQTCLLIGKVE